MFDPSIAADRLDRLWKLAAQFGTERGSNRIFLDEMVSDRLQLTAGLQLLRDELQFAPGPSAADRERARADLSLPSVGSSAASTAASSRMRTSAARARFFPIVSLSLRPVPSGNRAQTTSSSVSASTTSPRASAPRSGPANVSTSNVGSWLRQTSSLTYTAC